MRTKNNRESLNEFCFSVVFCTGVLNFRIELINYIYFKKILTAKYMYCYFVKKKNFFLCLVCT